MQKLLTLTRRSPERNPDTAAPWRVDAVIHGADALGLAPKSVLSPVVVFFSQLDRILEKVKEDASRKFELKVSYIEIYNNEINDLLLTSHEQPPAAAASGWASASSGRSLSARPAVKRQKIDIRYAAGRNDIAFTGDLTEEAIESREQARAESRPPVLSLCSTRAHTAHPLRRCRPFALR